MAKIVFFNRFFFPDQSATSQLVSDLAFHLAARGADVHVVTSASAPNLPPVELIRGVTVERVTQAGRPRSLVARGIHYLRFYRKARASAREIIGPGDIVILKTDPPMLSVAIGPIAHRCGGTVVNWLQDVFPEIASLYGIRGANALMGIRNKWLRQADKTVVIGQSMAEYIRRHAGVQPDRIEVIHNWADGRAIKPADLGMSALRTEWDLQDRFVVGYSGNLGRVHEFDTLLIAAELLRNSHKDIVFLIVGSGPRLHEVQETIRSRNLTNVHFRPPQPRASLSDSLALPDVHLCVLRPEFEGLVVPSKIYGIMAAGRPCIYIGDVNGEPARLLIENGAGKAVATGDSRALVEVILELRSASEIRAQMGRRSRQLFEAAFDFPIAAEKWSELVEELRLKHKPSA